MCRVLSVFDALGDAAAGFSNYTYCLVTFQLNPLEMNAMMSGGPYVPKELTKNRGLGTCVRRLNFTAGGPSPGSRVFVYTNELPWDSIQLPGEGTNAGKLWHMEKCDCREDNLEWVKRREEETFSTERLDRENEAYT